MKKIPKTVIQITAIPPTIPPTIGPVLLCFESGEDVALRVDERGVAVADGPGVVGDDAGDAELIDDEDEAFDDDEEVEVDDDTDNVEAARR